MHCRAPDPKGLQLCFSSSASKTHRSITIWQTPFEWQTAHSSLPQHCRGLCFSPRLLGNLLQNHNLQFRAQLELNLFRATLGLASMQHALLPPAEHIPPFVSCSSPHSASLIPSPMPRTAPAPSAQAIPVRWSSPVLTLHSQLLPRLCA